MGQLTELEQLKADKKEILNALRDLFNSTTKVYDNRHEYFEAMEVIAKHDGIPEDEVEGEPECERCRGPVSKTPNGMFLNCDDCGHNQKLEQEAP